MLLRIYEHVKFAFDLPKHTNRIFFAFPLGFNRFEAKQWRDGANGIPMRKFIFATQL